MHGGWLMENNELENKYQELVKNHNALIDYSENLSKNLGLMVGIINNLNCVLLENLPTKILKGDKIKKTQELLSELNKGFKI